MLAPLKVLLVCSTQGGHGGMEAFTLALARALFATDRVSPTVYFKLVRGFSWQESFLKKLAEMPFDVLASKASGSDIAKAFLRTDFVHTQNIPLGGVVFAYLLRKPIISTIHHAGLDGKWWRTFLWRSLSQLVDCRFYISSFIAHLWEGRTLSEDSAVFHTCSDFPPLKPLEFENRKGFLFISRLIEGKGLKTLLAAYANGKFDSEKWPLTIIGTGPLEAWGKAYANKKNLTGVHWLGYVGEELKWKTIAKSKWLLAVPESPEDFGLTPLEGWFRGIPSIVSAEGGLPEAAGPCGLFCPPRDEQALTEALRQVVLLTENDYHLLAQKGHRVFLDNFQQPEKYVYIYKNLLDFPPV